MPMTISRPGRGRCIAPWSWWLGVLMLAVTTPTEAQTGANAPQPAEAGKARLHVLHISTPQEMKDFFLYTEDRLPFISAHRGGPLPGFPENCLATFGHTLQNTWAVMEIDPHYTKDGAIVLMHDGTLDRTSTGHGKVSDHTLDEIRQLRLKDTLGKPTPYAIPTLDEALDWARGKTILILDQKDVPAVVRAQAIQKHHAQLHAMVMCYNFADARAVHDVDKNILMEVFIPDHAALERFDKTGVPWSNVVAFVSHNTPRDSSIFRQVHDKGSMCILGSSRNLDRDFIDGKITESARDDGYRQLILSGADVIEADLASDAGKAIESLQSKPSSKKPYFQDPQANPNP